MSIFVIRIPGEPFAQPRARAAVIAGRAVVYDPKVARNWKATAQDHMQQAAEREGFFSLAEAVALEVLAVFTCPKSDHRKRDRIGRRWHTKRPDGDNVLKAVKDAAKGVLWLDDSQVARSTVVKQIAAQDEAPYVEVRVRALRELVGQLEPHPPGLTLGGSDREIEWAEKGETWPPSAAGRI